MRLRVLAVAAVISGIMGGLIGAGTVQLFDGGNQNGTVSAPVPTGSDDADQGQVAAVSGECLSAADIYERVRPAVLQVTSAAGQSQATGTGFVIDQEGHILTNHHVINDATSIEVRFADGSTATAEVIGRDPANDLAVLRVTDPSIDLQVAALGDSSALRAGDQVLAIGNPFNLEATLTQGIVSAIDRTYATGANTRPIRKMIQTDAAVNPGNSGGPLLNCRGEVVGINTLLENPTGENVNVGVAFAVATDTAKRSLDKMLAGETVSHPWLGIAGVDVTPALAEELGLDAQDGVYITLVSPRSPAAESGLEGAFESQNQAQASSAIRAGGDLVQAVDGQPVQSIDALAAYLDEHKQPGDSVELSVLRDGENLSLTARLAEWPA